MGQTVRTATATTWEDSRILQSRTAMLRLGDVQPRFTEVSLSQVQVHSMRVQGDVMDQR